MNRIVPLILKNASVLLFLLVLIVFGLLSPRFFDTTNFLNILVQSSSVGIVAIGMTFVLLTAGIDLSVGSVMFLSAVIAGKLVLNGSSTIEAVLAILLVGIFCGLLNGLIITRLGIMAFIVTLGTLYVGRGLGLWISQTRAMNLPHQFAEIGSWTLLGLPFPVLMFVAVLILSHLLLTKTVLGKHIYAVGNDLEAANKAGIRPGRVLLIVYIISGFCAALGGLVSVVQLGAVSPTFGNQREFLAIAAAVLGGTSLFGGRGNLFPGTVLGAILIQTIENGLVIINADPYLYPMVMASIIFIAVLIDSFRNDYQKRISRRKIRVTEIRQKAQGL
jgi:ribose transport system permease protein